MAVDRALLRRVDISDAVALELKSRNRMLPRRWDDAALAAESSAVEAWLRPQLRRGPSGDKASLVFADKLRRGVRPLHVMTLEDRVLYRGLVGLISDALPERLRRRVPIDQFRTAPLEVPDTEYVSLTDVASYYEFVDHDLLCAELIAQTGEELAVDVLADLLASVLGRRVGLPQVHSASDILGDTYIDPVRRRMLRHGYTVFTYSDDFRIASASLGDARAALDRCAVEVRTLGLVLNDHKTFTYGARNYRHSLTAFSEAEQRLFADDQAADTAASLAALDSGYGDTDGELAAPLSLGITSPGTILEENEQALGPEDDEGPAEIDPARRRAAQRAWDLWENESEEIQGGQNAATAQALLGRALPMLGASGDPSPLQWLSELLRSEPALTPQIAAYVSAYGQIGQRARANLRSVLDDVTGGGALSTWQGMWIAHAAGNVRRSRRSHEYEDWLARCTTDSHDGLAATAAAALGRIGRGDPALVASAVERVGPQWRRLAFWGLVGLDYEQAEDTADDELDRLLLAAAAQ
ncbi:RNA-directed DNA polymerase [Spirillospora sp. CA-128828]|uniref:RNA-directed DNA polymerase n=1 Tax=Spirillospora sp. CA-128828 TaxID=3240033 RepID=UPI003D8BC06F